MRLIVFFCALLSLYASASDFSVANADGIILYYNKTGPKTVAVCKEQGNRYSGDIIIPAIVKYLGKSYTVTSIEENAFSWNSGITSIILPSTITNIGSSAFNNCSKMSSVFLPNSVVSIGNSAFRACESLTSIDLPDTLTEIGEYTFYGCKKLTSIELPESILSIGQMAFCKCSELKTLFLNKSICTIGFCAFQDCSSLLSVELPSSISNIESYAFTTDNNLTCIFNSPDGNAINFGINIFSEDCILYVPSGSAQSYSCFKNRVSEIREFDLCLNLTDGEPYTNRYLRTNYDAVYTRTFKNTNWQALYLPYNLSYDEWCDYVDIAEVSNVRGYDEDNDGFVDRTVIEFNKLTSGEIKPHTPYVIKAKNIGEVRLESHGKTILALPDTEGYVDCSSTRYVYTMYGVYETKTDLYSSGAYALSGGVFCQASDNAATLAPCRFYLMVTQTDQGYADVSSHKLPPRIEVRVDGETTNILTPECDEKNSSVYDLFGRPALEPSNGVYIKDGQKILIHK